MPNGKEMPNGNERRKNLSSEELEAIKTQLLDSIYTDIGRSVVKKILWIVGAIFSAALVTLAATGHIEKWLK
jgi:hypothetical protein